jgi:hypothetical protein
MYPAQCQHARFWSSILQVLSMDNLVFKPPSLVEGRHHRIRVSAYVSLCPPSPDIFLSSLSLRLCYPLNGISRRFKPLSQRACPTDAPPSLGLSFSSSRPTWTHSRYPTALHRVITTDFATAMAKARLFRWMYSTTRPSHCG